MKNGKVYIIFQHHGEDGMCEIGTKYKAKDARRFARRVKQEAKNPPRNEDGTRMHWLRRIHVVKIKQDRRSYDIETQREWQEEAAMMRRAEMEW